MTKPRRALTALLVVCTALAARAQERSSVDASAAAPAPPGAPAAPQVQSPALPAPGLSPGVDVSAPQQAAQSAAAQAAPTAAVQAPAVQAGPAMLAPARSAAAAALPPPAAAPPQVRRELGATVSAAGAAQRQQGSGGAIQTSGIFRRMYDEGRGSAGAARAQGGGAPGVAGREEPLADRVDQLSSLAGAASPYEAPGLYQQALDEILGASRDKSLELRMASRFAARLFGLAAPQGRRALPALAQAAAGAGPGQAARPLKAIKDWDRLFEAFGKPVMRRDAGTRALIAIALDHVRAGEVPDAGQRLPRAGSPAAESPVKRLPPLMIADAARDSSIPELSATWLEDVLAAHSRNPGADPGLLYRIARRGAARSVPAAAASAAEQTVQAWLEQAWQRLRELYLRYFGPQAAVDLGGGVVARGPASQVSGLARLRRAPSPEEAKAAVVAVDLSSVDEPYADAMRLLSGKAEMTPVRLRQVLSSARALADASVSLTGDPSGRRELDKLAARLSARPSRLDAELLAYWLGELQGAALARVELPARRAAGRGGDVVLSDLSRDGIILVAAPDGRAPALAGLGFDLSSPQAGVICARLSLSGMGPQARREALAAAVSAAGTGSAAAVSGGSSRQAAAALLAYVRANAAQARAAAAQLEAEAPFIRRRFETLGRVTIPQGRFILERSRRALAGRVEVVEALRGEEGRAVFARKTSLPLPR